MTYILPKLTLLHRWSVTDPTILQGLGHSRTAQIFWQSSRNRWGPSMTSSPMKIWGSIFIKSVTLTSFVTTPLPLEGEVTSSSHLAHCPPVLGYAPYSQVASPNLLQTHPSIFELQQSSQKNSGGINLRWHPTAYSRLGHGVPLILFALITHVFMQIRLRVHRRGKLWDWDPAQPRTSTIGRGCHRAIRKSQIWHIL